jgi:hypothetical protein
MVDCSSRRFSPDGLLTRRIAIDVPVARAAGVKKFFVIASNSAGLHNVEGKDEGAEHDKQDLN